MPEIRSLMCACSNQTQNKDEKKEQYKKDINTALLAVPSLLLPTQDSSTASPWDTSQKPPVYRRQRRPHRRAIRPNCLKILSRILL